MNKIYSNGKYAHRIGLWAIEKYYDYCAWVFHGKFHKINGHAHVDVWHLKCCTLYNRDIKINTRTLVL